MPLTQGQQLGAYQILDILGVGGMGEVYRARDTRLGREVALKVLPDLFASDPDRLARFEREARLLASLNHPNIAAIYGLEIADGVRFLVLELAPGETLEEIVDRGPLAVGDALRVCHQIAEALEAAHERGIIHRDLKPANIKVTPEGKVKVLDFGLAKALAGDPARPDLSKSPTVTFHYATRGEVILGTAPYMSPEQARGKTLDTRVDVWALGCILYEALTGWRAFAGETVSDILATILNKEPDWAALPRATPTRVRVLLRRCLQKDPKRRLHAIADARIEMEEALSSPPGEALAFRPWARAAPWAVAGVAIALAVFATWKAVSAPAWTPRPLKRFVISLPPTEPLKVGSAPALALSADGRRLVYAANRGGRTQLYLRAMDQLEPTPIPGTEDGEAPFFSPDGEWVGFYAAGRLKKISLIGGTAQPLAEGEDARGASWGLEGAVVFAPSTASGLSRVSSEGGAADPLTSPNSEQGERTHRWPQILPGGKAVLFTVGKAGDSSFDEARIAVQSLQGGAHRILIEGGSCGRYAPSGHLVYAREGALLAVPFDLERLQVGGSPVSLVEGVMTDPLTGAALFSFSNDGTLVYVPAGSGGEPPAGSGALLWVDRKGAARPLTERRHTFVQPRLSSDGGRLLVTISEGAGSDVWLADVTRGSLSRLTFDNASGSAIWTPDEKKATYVSRRGGSYSVILKPADGSAGEETLLAGENLKFPGGWTPDGQVLIFTEFHPDTGFDVMQIRQERPGVARPLLPRTPFNEGGAVLSPDGRWLAYVSNESGRDEVYVRPFPALDKKWLISSDGGTEPVWGRQGKDLFYRNQEKLMAVAIEAEPVFRPTPSRLLVEKGYDESETAFADYDVHPDGRRFVMVRSEQEAAPAELHMVLEWFTELDKRVR